MQPGNALAHFSLLGVFFRVLSASWVLLGCFWPILAVFIAFWCAPGPFWQGLGRVLETPKNYLQGFFVHASWLCENGPDLQKTQFFLGFSMFFAYRKFHTEAKKRHKIVDTACPTQVPSNSMLKTRFGTRRARFWRGLMGSSWAPLGYLLDAVGRLLGSLERFLSTSGLLWGCS